MNIKQNQQKETDRLALQKTKQIGYPLWNSQELFNANLVQKNEDLLITIDVHFH
uniref:Uncharacterized protein n=1 Tax=Rhizophora mucronata TaxID=61149 RepID=A0A2P2J1A3_RHIMU